MQKIISGSWLWRSTTSTNLPPGERDRIGVQQKGAQQGWQTYCHDSTFRSFRLFSVWCPENDFLLSRSTSSTCWVPEKLHLLSLKSRLICRWMMCRKKVCTNNAAVFFVFFFSYDCKTDDCGSGLYPLSASWSLDSVLLQSLEKSV